MTISRRFTLSTHAVLELVLGLATLASPALLGFSHAGLLLAVLLGSLLVGMAVTAGADSRTSPAWHQLFDLTFVIATALTALGLALAGDSRAAWCFAVLTVLQTALNAATRYVASF
ncbi:MAG TPA: hypothetical protein VG186_14395 [Solirubrobacteraceae bacterium]|jgi:hypothetical protein|nr:hypothetical protein [Solirubrobacteraceae bacterium]